MINPKRCNICKIRIPEGEEREMGAKEIFEEIIAEYFKKLMTDTNTGSSQNTKKDKHQKNTKPKHIIFKLETIKNKEKIMKEVGVAGSVIRG